MVKDRYYKDEEVDVTVNKKRLKGKVVFVVLPSAENGMSDDSEQVSSQLPSPAPFTPVLELTSVETLSMTQSSVELLENSVTLGDSSYEMDGEKDRAVSSPKQSPSKRRKKSPKTPICSAALLDPNRYKYSVEVKDVNGVQVVELPASDVMRVRNSVTREKLRLLIRYATYKQENSDKYPLLVKDALVSKYQLGDRPFLPGPIEHTPLSRAKSPKKRKFSQSSIDKYFSKSDDSSPRKKKKMNLSLDSKTPEKSPGRTKKPKTPTPHKTERKWTKEALKKMLRHKRVAPKKRERLHKELKKILDEEKEKRRAEKAIVRKQVKEQKEKEKEIKKEEEERLREWYRPREDLACDDSQPLPPTEPLPYQLPVELFPQAVMVLEYLRLFTPLFDIDGPKPNIISFAKLEESLLECDPDCALYSILRFLLLALFVTMDDEEEKEVSLSNSELAVSRGNPSEEGKVVEGQGEPSNEQLPEVFTETLDDVNERTKDAVMKEGTDTEDEADNEPSSAPIALSPATIYASWAQRHQGIPLRSIQLDYFTLTEILRLHLLSSGQTRSSSACRVFRYQSRGGYAVSDDPGIEFCKKNTALLQKMLKLSVYDLLPGEKLSLISVLCHQLLTYSIVRDALDESAANLKAARRQYRNLCNELERLHKPPRRRKDKKDLESSKEKENVEATEVPVPKKRKKKPSKKNLSQNNMPDGKPPVPPKMSPVANNDKDREEDELEVDMESKRQELVDGMAEAMKEVIKHSQATNLKPLGRDRWDRVYWWFPTMPGLYVERTTSAQSIQSPVRMATMDPLVRPDDLLWSRYSADEETIGDLMVGLNSRGIRESQLKEQLSLYKNEMISSTEKLLRKREAKTTPTEYESAEDYMELSLRDHLLELEDNVYCGNLGYVRSELSRAEWIKSMENSALAEKYFRKKDGKTKVTEQKPKDDLPNKQDVPSADMDVSAIDSMPCSPTVGLGTSSGASTPFINPSVKEMSSILLSIQGGIEARFLKQPFGKGLEDTNEVSRRMKKAEPGKNVSPPAEQWTSSLRSCTSFAQIFIHLYTLDRTIIWSKSLQNIRCRKCRKKGGDEYLLLCDRCDNGYHTYCLDPPLLEIPDADWFCNYCQPASPVKLRRVSSVRRKAADEDSDDDSRDTDEESSDNDVARRRQTNRKNIPLPRRSARIISKRRPSEESDDSENSNASEEDNSMNDEEESPLLTLQLKTETVLEELGASSGGTRAYNSKVKQLHECLLDELLEHKDGFILEKLPKKAEAPEYYKVVKDPVDLHMLKVKANNEGYLRNDLFIQEVQKMFDNSFKYYRGGSERQSGKNLEEYFHSRLVELGLQPKKKALPAGTGSVESVNEDEVPEDARTRTCIAVTEMKDTQQGTRPYNAKVRVVHERLLEELALHRSGSLMKLPSRKKCPDYYELVEYPIDVQQLRIRAKKEGFESHEQLHKEVQCLVQNTLIYYGEDSEEGCHAHNVDKYMNKRLKDLGLVTKKAKGKKRRKL